MVIISPTWIIILKFTQKISALNGLISPEEGSSTDQTILMICNGTGNHTMYLGRIRTGSPNMASGISIVVASF